MTATPGSAELLALATDLSNHTLGSRTRAVEMLRRLAAKPADEEWQDISTAPKDGTHFLACRGPYYPHWGFDQSPPFVVHYWPVPREEDFYLSHGVVQESDNDRSMEFTHWRRLGSVPALSPTGAPKP